MPLKRQAKDSGDGISNVKAWLVGLASILIAFTVLITYLALSTEELDYHSVEAYVGLTETDAIQKADAEDVEHHTYAHNQRVAAIDRGVVGLILYTDNGKVVGAETRAPTQDSRARPFIGLTESEAVQAAENDGRPHRVVMRDGEHQEITLDLSLSRINFTIEDSIVVKAEFY